MVGEDEGCIPDKYPGQQTTVVVHSSTTDKMEKDMMEGGEGAGDTNSGEIIESDSPYTPSLDLRQVMELLSTSYDGYYGKRYVVGGAGKDFFEASNICRDLGGH